MAATVDNLSSHYSYRVIRGFVDANGVQVLFDTVGVIRHIDISDDWTQIIVDWEQDGKTQKLVFPMNAADGPRNNHMRTYFEKGELSRPPREPKSIPEPAAESAPDTPQADPSLDRFGGTHPQEEVMLGPLKVACGCDPVFHRPVWPAVHTSVNACLRCGAVTVTRQVGDDGRFTGDAWTAYWTVPTPQAIADWLGHFPRVAVDHAGARWRWPMSAELARYPILVYPADTRVSDRAELDALEARLWQEQANQPRAVRLGSACGSIPAVPPGVPQALSAFILARHVLYMRSGSDLDMLKAHANLRSASTELAAHLLLLRPDAYGIMMEWLASSDENRFSACIAMLRDSRSIFTGPDDPRLAPEILRIMNGLTLEPASEVPGRIASWYRFEAFLVSIADLGANSAAMLDGLSALMNKVRAKDGVVFDAMRIVINELNGVNNRPPQYR